MSRDVVIADVIRQETRQLKMPGAAREFECVHGGCAATPAHYTSGTARHASVDAIKMAAAPWTGPGVR